MDQILSKLTVNHEEEIQDIKEKLKQQLFEEECQKMMETNMKDLIESLRPSVWR